MALVTVLLTACPSMQEEKRSTRLQEATQAYLSSLRWGYYDLAAQMIVHRESVPEPVNFEYLRNIRVTTYETQNQIPTGDPNAAKFVVLISYYHTGYGTVKTITDHQTWRYEEQTKRWFLDGNLPDFKGGLARRY